MYLKFLPTRMLRKRQVRSRRKREPRSSSNSFATCGILRWVERRATSEVVYVPPQQRGFSMDREHVKGAADKAKGAIKDAAGKVTGDKELQTEGKLDKAKGSAHNAAGDVKEALRNASKDD
jgi:uncharacterized protein YjbJ (UPF0337 family)